MTVVALLVTGAIVNLLVAELFAWFPWLAESLVRTAVSRLPPSVRERYLEEWLGEIESLPGKGISSLLFSLHVLVGVPKLRDEIVHGSVNASSQGQVAKRTLDGAWSLATLVLLLPIFLAVGLALRLSSKGPILSREPYVGRDGAIFQLYRFRTVRLPAKSRFVCENELTIVGRLLWRSSLDELPQILNVLRGDMSLVGPPPMHADLARVVRQNAEDRDMRLGVRPGITGWAQVHGIRGKASFAERIEWDKYYISHWSFWLDLKILALTVLTVLSVNRR